MTFKLWRSKKKRRALPVVILLKDSKGSRSHYNPDTGDTPQNIVFLNNRNNNQKKIRFRKRSGRVRPLNHFKEV